MKLERKNNRKIKKSITPNSQYVIDEVKQKLDDKLEESVVEEYGDDCDQDEDGEMNHEADEMTWGDVEVEC